MKTFTVLSKEYENIGMLLADDVIQGLLTGELFALQFEPIENTLTPMLLKHVIEDYYFPEFLGEHDINLLHFLKGKNPELFDQVEFYECLPVEVN